MALTLCALLKSHGDKQTKSSIKRADTNNRAGSSFFIGYRDATSTDEGTSTASIA
jgi:hypothetical protein